MKFLCLECNAAMKLYRTGAPDEGSLDVRFECPKCLHQVAMLTNPFETQIVSSLGVTIGGTSDATDENQAATDTESPPKRETASETGSPSSTDSIPWSSGARRRLDRIPAFVRPMAVSAIEQFARDNDYKRIDEEVLDKAKERFGM